MNSSISCTFTMAGWDEKTVHEFDDGCKVSHVTVKKIYSGDLEAEGTLEYVMFYRKDGMVEYSGYERIVGTLNGKSGSFVIEDRGKFEQGVASSKLTIIKGTGTSDLAGISGHGSYRLEHAEEYALTLKCDL